MKTIKKSRVIPSSHLFLLQFEERKKEKEIEAKEILKEIYCYHVTRDYFFLIDLFKYNIEI